MSTAQVTLWGREAGAVYVEEGQAYFQYYPEFVQAGLELSPLKLPLSDRVYQFTGPFEAGLPGLLADSLPDRFGNALIDSWLAARGVQPEDFDVVDRLSYIGTRGMGALEYRPSKGPTGNKRRAIDIGEMVELSSLALHDREGFESSLHEDHVKDLLAIGTSAGGARAKAVIAWNPKNGKVRSGQVDAGPEFEHWLIKFDGVKDAREGDLDESDGYGRIEYAYHLMASAAGVTMRGVTKAFGSNVVLRELDLDVAPGERVVIIGPSGSGKTTILRVIMTLERPDSGTIEIDGHDEVELKSGVSTGLNDVTTASARYRRELGLSHVPEDRNGRGLVTPYTAAMNSILGDHYHPPYSNRLGLLDESAIEDHAVRLIKDYDVRPTDPNITVSHYSGGNAQKLIVARELERRHPDLVTAAWWKEERGRRIFVDFNQNAPHKTVFGAWSVRPKVGGQGPPHRGGRPRRVPAVAMTEARAKDAESQAGLRLRRVRIRPRSSTTARALPPECRRPADVAGQAGGRDSPH